MCWQLAKPNPMCLQSEIPTIVTFCGAEQWIHNGNEECKQFEKFTVFCANGTIVEYTDERWFGVGSICSEGTCH